jgi:hypothetical protein
MRRLGILILTVAGIGLFAGMTPVSAEQPNYSYSYSPSGYSYCPDSPELIARSADALTGVLNTISSPQRRDLLAEQWIQFSKQTIAKSLAFREEWLTLQKQQVVNQQEAQQLRVEMLRMEGEIERMRAANLKLQNENLQLQMQLKQQTGDQVPSSAPQTQAPPAASRAQPTLGK